MSPAVAPPAVSAVPGLLTAGLDSLSRHPLLVILRVGQRIIGFGVFACGFLPLAGPVLRMASEAQARGLDHGELTSLVESNLQVQLLGRLPWTFLSMMIAGLLAGTLAFAVRAVILGRLAGDDSPIRPLLRARFWPLIGLHVTWHMIVMAVTAPALIIATHRLRQLQIADGELIASIFRPSGFVLTVAAAVGFLFFRPAEAILTVEGQSLRPTMRRTLDLLRRSRPPMAWTVFAVGIISALASAIALFPNLFPAPADPATAALASLVGLIAFAVATVVAAIVDVWGMATLVGVAESTAESRSKR